MNLKSQQLWQALAKHGERATLTRNGKTIELFCRPLLSRFAVELVGEIGLDRVVIVISHNELEQAGWGKPNKATDKIKYQDRTCTLDSVISHTEGGEYCRHEILVRLP